VTGELDVRFVRFEERLDNSSVAYWKLQFTSALLKPYRKQLTVKIDQLRPLYDTDKSRIKDQKV